MAKSGIGGAAANKFTTRDGQPKPAMGGKSSKGLTASGGVTAGTKVVPRTGGNKGPGDPAGIGAGNVRAAEGQASSKLFKPMATNVSGAKPSGTGNRW